MPTDDELRSRKEGNESFSQLASRLESAAQEADAHTQVLNTTYPLMISMAYWISPFTDTFEH